MPGDITHELWAVATPSSSAWPVTDVVAVVSASRVSHAPSTRRPVEAVSDTAIVDCCTTDVPRSTTCSEYALMMRPCSAGGETSPDPVDTCTAATAWVAVGLKSETTTSDRPDVEPAAM